MSSRPTPLILLTVGGALLGALLALDGLSARLFGEFLQALGDRRLWLDLVDTFLRSSSLALEPVNIYQAGWIPLVLGTALSGALTAAWIGLRWGLNAIAFIAALALLNGGFVSALAVGVLLGALLPATRSWMATAAAG